VAEAAPHGVEAWLDTYRSIRNRLSYGFRYDVSWFISASDPADPSADASAGIELALR